MERMEMIEPRDFDRIRFVTRHFHDLQGLQSWVPIGLILLSAGAAAYFPSWPSALLPAVLLLGASLLALGARRYYRNNFGQVEPQQIQPAAESVSIFSPAGPTLRLASFPPVIPRWPRALLILGMAPALFLLYQFILGPPWVKLPSGVLLWRPILISWAPWSTSILSILSGSFFFGCWFLRGCRRSQSYYLVLGGLLLGLSAFGAASLGLTLLLCGSALILAGLLDHWQLVRSLGRAS